jgi:hypothetical protein
MKNWSNVALACSIILAPGATVAAAAEPADNELKTVLSSLMQPTLAANARQVDRYTMKFGNTVFTLAGEVEGVLGAGRTVGFAFRGEGRGAVSLVEGPFRQANLATIKDEGEIKNLDGTNYTFTFAGAVFFTNAVPDDLLAGERTTDSSLGDVLTRSVDRWHDTRNPALDHTLAPFIFQAETDPAMIAVLWQGDKDSLYRCEMTDAGEEQYGELKKVPSETGLSFHYLDTLIHQPAELDLKRRPIHDFEQTAIDLELVSTDNVNAHETTKTTLVAGRDGLRLVTFDMLNGRAENPVDWDERSHPIDITSVRTTTGTNLQFSHKYDQLMVLLPTPLAKGQAIELAFEASGGLLKNFSGDAYLVLGNMSYFPQLDIYSTRATFHSVVKVREPFIPIACGRTIRRWTEGGLNCLESREDRPVAFPFVVVGDFVVEERQEAGYDIRVYSYGGAKKRGAKRLIQNGLAVLSFYSSGMEPFPYHELEVIEIPYYRHFFWQAPAGLVEITSEGLGALAGDTSDINTYIKRAASVGQNSRYAHEIAHQWFGNIIGWATPYDNWLSESFAEYLSYLFMSEGAGEKGKAKEQFDNWKTDTKECADVSSIYGASSLEGDRDSRQCYTQLLYGKGPLVLHALRQDMGDAQFKKMLYLMTTAAAKKTDLKMITDDVIYIASAITKKDYLPWFERYVYGTEVPPITD